MKEVTRFQAADGAEFREKDKCLEYETLIEEVSGIVKALNPIPDMKGCDFANGYGFVQQDKKIIQIVKKQLLRVAKRYIKHDWIDQTLKDDTVHPSYAARLIGEVPFLSPLYGGWNRISNIDKMDREWGQGYFAEHPEESPALKGKQ